MKADTIDVLVCCLCQVSGKISDRKGIPQASTEVRRFEEKYSEIEIN